MGVCLHQLSQLEVTLSFTALPDLGRNQAAEAAQPLKERSQINRVSEENKTLSQML